VKTPPVELKTPDLLGHYAGFMSRLLAMLIDTLIISSPLLPLPGSFRDRDGPPLRTFVGFSINAIPGSSTFIDHLLGPYRALLTAAYWSLTMFFWVLTGQTPGKL
jgi:uncharacterized RDD family membrane protein YckC